MQKFVLISCLKVEQAVEIAKRKEYNPQNTHIIHISGDKETRALRIKNLGVMIEAGDAEVIGCHGVFTVDELEVLKCEVTSL